MTVDIGSLWNSHPCLQQWWLVATIKAEHLWFQQLVTIAFFLVDGMCVQSFNLWGCLWCANVLAVFVSEQNNANIIV